MNTRKIITLVILLMLGTSTIFAQKKSIPTGTTTTKPSTTTSNATTMGGDKIVAGLKEALTVATNVATTKVSVLDGYYKNTLIKIPYPAEVKQVMDVARKVPGGDKYVDDFVKSLNRAAEDAAKTAAPVFIDAVKQMTITDGLSIVKGTSNEATMYLKSKSQAALKAKYQPIVKNALAKAQVTKYWTKVASYYNKVPFVKKVNPNLEEYTTQKALDGLFLMIGKEEEKIRKDPGARVTSVLKDVFGTVFK